jgi:hypothetical protein
MPAVLEHAPHIQERPHPKSHDCAHEHSLDHWLEVHSMVEEEYFFAEFCDVTAQPDAISVRKHPARSAVHHYRSAPHL